MISALHILLLIRITTSAPFNVSVVVIGEDGTSLPFSYQKTMPAVNLAEEILKKTYRNYINFNFIYNMTQCSGDGTGAMAADLHCKHEISVFIGPGCSAALEVISQLSKSWNIPLVTPVGSAVTNRTLYPLVTTVSPYTAVNYAKGMDTVIRYFKWSTVTIIYDAEYSVAEMMKNEFLSRFGGHPSNQYDIYMFRASSYNNETLQKIWQAATQRARIFMIFCKEPESRALMLNAYAMGYATSGQYAFIIRESFSRYPSPFIDDQTYLKSVGHVLWPYVDKWKSEDMNFTAEVIRRSLNDYNYDYQGKEVSTYIACYYDAVLMYASVLNDTLFEGGDPKNGTALTHKMWNNTFPGVHEQVKMNENGYRESDLTFAVYSLSTGLLTPVLIWQYDTDTIDSVVSSSDIMWPYNHGVRPLDVPECGFENESCKEKSLSSSIIGAIAGILGVLSFTGVTVAALLYRAWRKQYEHDLWWWKIHFNELTSTNWSGASSVYSKASLKSLAGSELTDVAGDSKFAVWKCQVVRLRKLPAKYVHINSTILEEFKMLRDLSHANIIHIHGACIEDHIKLLVTEPCIKGSLGDLLGNTDVALDTQFKFSLCTDVINGLCYIHDSAVKYHGRLTSEVCLIDNRFSVKLADFGLPSLFHECHDDVISQEYKHDCMWKAPEVLRSGAAHTGSKEADVYSFAIILQEILTKDSPYSVESAYMTIDEIISKVVAISNPPFRPTIELPNSMVVMTSLIESCWSEDPRQRPTSRSVRLTLKKIATSMGETGHLMDDLMRRMEMYATNLEKMVDEKTRELREEKKKSEQLLDQILPRSVADCLKAGQRVEPQAYECVTIYFSDIVGFTTLSGKSSPMEVVDLLNDLYSCFDSTIEAYDVYKVETIGDAYMVVSGLPQRNGNFHVVNIAKMSISVLENIKEFKIRHLPEERLQIRIGLHSGPVCAGVVGLKMPRYCLFGDTVNTASRMESYGKAMMIHISPSCKVLLDQFGSFHIKPRGRITIKGKGDMFTYWLVPSSSIESNVVVNSEED